MVTPIIQRKIVIREPIPVGLRLSLTLRFLAAGESMVSLAYLYRIGKSTTSLIIKETCLAIWEVLQPQVLLPPTPEGWRQIGEDFGTSQTAWEPSMGNMWSCSASTMKAAPREERAMEGFSTRANLDKPSLEKGSLCPNLCLYKGFQFLCRRFFLETRLFLSCHS
ncbi:hypothetical protein GE061_000066 [Apolygus lucorum]|uniref:Transposase Helix-turn-helix domain-containing protein n=1 Tax=Apolygus lucorum TaxID=248454 RepID=A0A8S9Y4I0_APOLU|nr:hypothetical protein GE061_000066 [Apolygus lucorum]